MSRPSRLRSLLAVGLWDFGGGTCRYRLLRRHPPLIRVVTSKSQAAECVAVAQSLNPDVTRPLWGRKRNGSFFTARPENGHIIKRLVACLIWPAGSQLISPLATSIPCVLGASQWVSELRWQPLLYYPCTRCSSGGGCSGNLNAKHSQGKIVVEIARSC